MFEILAVFGIGIAVVAAIDYLGACSKIRTIYDLLPPESQEEKVGDEDASSR